MLKRLFESSSAAPQPLHLPISEEEARALGWWPLDVVIITGDAHCDHPSFPAALLGRALVAHGFRVGVISRPDVADVRSVSVLGCPRCYFGVTAGALDSMVANYTALKRRRSDDAYAPGGLAGGRPDRAVTVYCNMVRQVFGKQALVVAGGIEASLRRFAHYDYWSDRVRRSLLLDCGADVLVAGMGEGPAVAIAEIVRRNGGFDVSGRHDVGMIRNELASCPGVVVKQPASLSVPDGAIELPDSDTIVADPSMLRAAFRTEEKHGDQVLHQRSSGMRVVANPPWPQLSTAEIDALYALPFTRDPHPSYGGQTIPALTQVRFAAVSHRGCCGGCAFCAISAHQGRKVASRRPESIIAEVGRISHHPAFKGTVTDIGGPSANMYGARCVRPGSCRRPSCLWPRRCPHLSLDQSAYGRLLNQAAAVQGVKHCFVSSGLRMDLAAADPAALAAVLARYISGHLKIAPEHISADVLSCMRKPAAPSLADFMILHRDLARQTGAETMRAQVVLPYLMAAHPGCDMDDMARLGVALMQLGVQAEQCQIFTPTPGTASSVSYLTGLGIEHDEPLFVERDPVRKQLQKSLILYHLPEFATQIREALALCSPDVAAAYRSLWRPVDTSPGREQPDASCRRHTHRHR